MSELKFPQCPTCEKLLTPLSACLGDFQEKTYAHWICLHCGFYVGTTDSKGYNIPKDLWIGAIPGLPSAIKELKKDMRIRRRFIDVR